MNLEAKEQKDLQIANCWSIYSFEDQVLIQTKESRYIRYRLFKYKEGELQLLDEKTGA